MSELGKTAWPTMGRYIYRSNLQAFIDEIGHEIPLMQGAIDPESSTTETDDTALTAAIEQIRKTAATCAEAGIETEGEGESEVEMCTFLLEASDHEIENKAEEREDGEDENQKGDENDSLSEMFRW